MLGLGRGSEGERRGNLEEGVMDLAHRRVVALVDGVPCGGEALCLIELHMTIRPTEGEGRGQECVRAEQQGGRERSQSSTHRRETVCERVGRGAETVLAATTKAS